jgi:hypothetical protein
LFSPTGFRFLSANATLADVISAFNNNFSEQVQADEFDRQLKARLSPLPQPQVRFKASSPSKQSPKKKPTDLEDFVKRQIGRLRFTQVSIVRKKIKVENPRDGNQWVVDDRVKALVMRDNRTGAQWTWQDSNAGRGISAGNEETINGEGS